MEIILVWVYLFFLLNKGLFEWSVFDFWHAFCTIFLQHLLTYFNKLEFGFYRLR